eukprot:6172382-Pleurochrysis_carterae.AAC.2
MVQKLRKTSRTRLNGVTRFRQALSANSGGVTYALVVICGMPRMQFRRGRKTRDSRREREGMGISANNNQQFAEARAGRGAEPCANRYFDSAHTGTYSARKQE